MRRHEVIASVSLALLLMFGTGCSSRQAGEGDKTDQTVAQLAEARAEADRLAAELARARDNTRVLSADLSGARRHAERVTAELKQANARVDLLAAELKKAQAEAAKKPPPPPTYLTLDLGKGVKMKLVLIPAGKFLMGSGLSPDQTAKRYRVDAPDPTYERLPANRLGQAAGWKARPPFDFKHEHPPHEVTISPGAPGFYMGIYEVTGQQWDAVMGTLGTGGSKYPDSVKPARAVNWHQAEEFCGELSRRTGRHVSLPTEAQWEYACRAGSTTEFCFGDDAAELWRYAWFGDDRTDSVTHPVGQKKPNAWGLYDMHGNAWEWCSDWWGAYPSAKAVDPHGPASGKWRVARGGSYSTAAWTCRSACRYSAEPGKAVFGFRVVVSADEGP